MKKFLSVLMSLVLLVTVFTRLSFAVAESSVQNQDGTCLVRDDCSCNCVCNPSEVGPLKCEILSDCACLDARKGLFHYLTLPLRGAWSFLSNDAAAMWKALGQFTWYQNIFNVVALFFIGAMMFRD